MVRGQAGGSVDPGGAGTYHRNAKVFHILSRSDPASSRLSRLASDQCSHASWCSCGGKASTNGGSGTIDARLAPPGESNPAKTTVAASAKGMAASLRSSSYAIASTGQ